MREEDVDDLKDFPIEEVCESLIAGGGCLLVVRDGSIVNVPVGTWDRPSTEELTDRLIGSLADVATIVRDVV